MLEKSPSEKNTDRPPFTLEQLAEARRSGFVRENHRKRRLRERTYAIDDLPPETPADRDDGLLVNITADGAGYHLRISIADVAAHIPPHSPLAEAVKQRAETLYLPLGRDSMFPPDLENRMSLEHQKERLALTLCFDLDANFQVKGWQIERSLSEVAAHDYQQFHDEAATNTDIQLLNRVAKGLKGQHQELSLFEKADKDPHAPKPSKLVSGYMILANNKVATLFAEAGLPFIYRNFTKQDDRATYDSVNIGHTATANQAYAHVTSPLRRGADFFNQQMMHYVTDQAERLIDAIVPHTSQSKTEIIRIVWQQAPHWLKQMQQARLQQNEQSRADLNQVLENLLLSCGIDNPELARPVTFQLANQLVSHSPPYERIDMTNIANQLSQGQRQRKARHRQTDAFRKSKERLEKMEAFASLDLEHGKLLQYVTDAANTGLLPEPLLDAIIAKLQQKPDDLPAVCAQAMLRDTPTETPAWQRLKRFLCEKIKHDPSAVNAVFDVAQAASILKSKAFHVGEVSLPVDGEREHYLHASLVVYDHPDYPQGVSAPFYSIGHDTRAATSHARYAFLENAAFGQLQPVDQAAIPSPLYAELNFGRGSKRDVLQKMAQSIGAGLEVTLHSSKEVELVIDGGAWENPLRLLLPPPAKESLADEQLIDRACRHMLRLRAFKEALRIDTPQALYLQSNPMLRLRLWMEEQGQGWQMNVTEKRATHSKSPHEVEIQLVNTDGHAHVYHGQGPNLDRARHAAANAALRALDVPQTIISDVRVQSWTQDASLLR